MTWRAARRLWTLAILLSAIPEGVACQHILIVYYSGTGHTALLADAVASGARGIAGSDVRLLSVDSVSHNDVAWIGAAFVTAGGISAGEETVQLAILRAMLVYNMIVVGGPTWTEAFGASAVTVEPPFADTAATASIDSIFVAKGSRLGARVAEVANLLKGRGGR